MADLNFTIPRQLLLLSGKITAEFDPNNYLTDSIQIDVSLATMIFPGVFPPSTTPQYYIQVNDDINKYINFENSENLKYGISEISFNSTDYISPVIYVPSAIKDVSAGRVNVKNNLDMTVGKLNITARLDASSNGKLYVTSVQSTGASIDVTAYEDESEPRDGWRQIVAYFPLLESAPPRPLDGVDILSQTLTEASMNTVLADFPDIHHDSDLISKWNIKFDKQLYSSSNNLAKYAYAHMKSHRDLFIPGDKIVTDISCSYNVQVRDFNDTSVTIAGPGNVYGVVKQTYSDITCDWCGSFGDSLSDMGNIGRSIFNTILDAGKPLVTLQLAALTHGISLTSYMDLGGEFRNDLPDDNILNVATYLNNIAEYNNNAKRAAKADSQESNFGKVTSAMFHGGTGSQELSAFVHDRTPARLNAFNSTSAGMAFTLEGLSNVVAEFINILDEQLDANFQKFADGTADGGVQKLLGMAGPDTISAVFIGEQARSPTTSLAATDLISSISGKFATDNLWSLVQQDEDETTVGAAGKNAIRVLIPILNLNPYRYKANGVYSGNICNGKVWTSLLPQYLNLNTTAYAQATRPSLDSGNGYAWSGATVKNGEYGLGKQVYEWKSRGGCKDADDEPTTNSFATMLCGSNDIIAALQPMVADLFSGELLTNENLSAIYLLGVTDGSIGDANSGELYSQIEGLPGDFGSNFKSAIQDIDSVAEHLASLANDVTTAPSLAGWGVDYNKLDTLLLLGVPPATIAPRYMAFPVQSKKFIKFMCDRFNTVTQHYLDLTANPSIKYCDIDKWATTISDDAHTLELNNSDPAYTAPTLGQFPYTEPTLFTDAIPLATPGQEDIYMFADEIHPSKFGHIKLTEFMIWPAVNQLSTLDYDARS